MTKEEAIELLEKEKEYMLGHGGDRQTNALAMAIKALEQEPCEGAISRQAVEKITWEEPSYSDALNVLTEVRDKVRALPPVTPTISDIDKFNDSVNRATVLALINDVKNADGFKDYSQYDYLFDQVDKMPMASPTRKKGKWIYYIDEQGWSMTYPVKCSNCNTRFTWSNFCPNCGAEMGVEE